MAEILQGRYQLEEMLGQGGMGMTHKATDLHTLQTVAVKQLHLSHLKDWKILELFEREANILQQLHHPRLPAYRDYFSIDTERDTQFCLVQDYIEGKTLKQVIEEGWRGTEKEIFDIFRQLVGILAYLHGLRPPVIHRDLNPKNIICAPAKTSGASPFDVYLVDFGAVQDQIRTSEYGGGSTTIGTYGYMPLEQFNGRAVPASDYYALGATLLFMLSHRHPGEFEITDLKIDFRSVLNVSPTMSLLLNGLLEPSAEKRLDSPQEIKALLAQKSVPQPQPSIANPPPKKPKTLLDALEAFAQAGERIAAQQTPAPPTSEPPLPYNCTIQKIEHDAQHIDFIIPGRFHHDVITMVGVSLFLFAFMSIITIAAFESGKYLVLLITVSFWIIGVFIAKSNFFNAFGSTAISITPENVEITFSWWMFKNTHRLPTRSIHTIDQTVWHTQNNKAVTGINLHGETRTLKLGSHLTPPEREWLLYELQSFIKQVK